MEFTREKAAAMTLSSTVIRPRGLTTWKVRPMPRWQILWGFIPWISRPWKSTFPDVGGGTPLIMLNVVVFPEPLGPIRPKISPSCTSKVTSLTAVRPPKYLDEFFHPEERHVRLLISPA